jgi:hypothetical protein
MILGKLHELQSTKGAPLVASIRWTFDTEDDDREKEVALESGALVRPVRLRIHTTASGSGASSSSRMRASAACRASASLVGLRLGWQALAAWALRSTSAPFQAITQPQAERAFEFRVEAHQLKHAKRRLHPTCEPMAVHAVALALDLDATRVLRAPTSSRIGLVPARLEPHVSPEQRFDSDPTRRSTRIDRNPRWNHVQVVHSS